MSMISTLNDRNLDIVFCIDTTGNNFLFLETLQHEFKGFYEKLGSLLSDDAKEFDICLNILQASGGADVNNGLEALFYAMATDWNAPSSNLL